MEIVEDSGFDSDHKTSASVSMAEESVAKIHEPAVPPCENVDLEDPPEDIAFSASTSRKKLSGLQRKLDKQRQASLKLHASLHQQQPKSGVRGILARSRLNSGSKADSSIEDSQEASQPLVVIDESEDEFAASKRLWRKSTAPMSDMVKQLACDGYDLDLQPDDSDLDLIPPRPLSERRCLCCYNGSLQSMCILQ